MLADKAPIEIQNGRSPALYLKKIQNICVNQWTACTAA